MQTHHLLTLFAIAGCAAVAGTVGGSDTNTDDTEELFDDDGDGYYSDVDCDDSDPAVNPSAEEICDNGLDDDCDGGAGACGWDGEFSLETPDAELVFGSPTGLILAGAEDVNGDGYLDVGAAGEASELAAVALVMPEGEIQLDASNAVLFGDDLGGALAFVPDINGDGLHEVAVGGQYSDVNTALFLSPLEAGELTPDDAALRITGMQKGSFVLFGATDLTGDGAVDLISIDAYDNNDGGYLYVHDAAASGDVDASAAATVLSADSLNLMGIEDSNFNPIIDCGDLDADGFDDLALGSTTNLDGRVWVVLGPLPMGSASITDADVTIKQPESGGYQTIGSAVAASGDLDGDGRVDLVAGAWGADPQAPDSAFARPGAVFMFTELPSGDADALTDAWGIVLGSEDDETLGGRIELGTVDGADTADMLVSGYGSGYGIVRLFTEPSSGTSTSADAAATFWGEDIDVNAGYSVALSDLDRDGLDDLIISPDHDRDWGWYDSPVYVMYTPGGI